MDEIPESASGSVALNVPLQNVLKDVSLLCLGSSGNLNFSKDVGIAVGKILKEKGGSYYIFGSFDVLRRTDPDPLSKVSTSPYITAQVLSLLAEGLSIAGVVPVFNATGEVNDQVIAALITRKATYPVMVESAEKYEQLKRLGYTTTLVIDTKGNVLVGKPLKFSWSYEKEIDYESLRREVLENSIVLLDRNIRKISVNDPWSGGVLVFSNEEWLLKIAQDVLNGRRSPTGRAP
ncbi:MULTISPECIES: hypothetical protein [unclassified Thermotoga]|uniref:hypothetical protein n=1 Tax=unclassified Thermotoga TaxID=2631113 RepID=UPI0005443C7A|nr:MULTISPECIES: hypothetical protein [unclassified Thermotoga]KHC90337.1 hypothetical protein Mc24_08244 [Thermotoga sp. Mc24]